MKDAEIKHKRSEMMFALYSAITIYGLSHVPFIALLYLLISAVGAASLVYKGWSLRQVIS